jgi:segregation and condensation protein B
MTESPPLKQILEAALLASGGPLDVGRLQSLFEEDRQPPPQTIRNALQALAEEYHGRGMELVEVASGWRIQVPPAYAPWVARLFEERPGRYSRALLETLAIIAYRQPALLVTTRHFLDYFGLRSLDDLPTLQALRDLDQIEAELPFAEPPLPIADSGPEPGGEYP